MGINDSDSDSTRETSRICQLAKPIPIGTDSRLKEFNVFRIGIILLFASWFVIILLPIALILIMYSQKETIGRLPYTLKKRKTTVILVIVVIGIIAWSPWITEDYALDIVVARAGGPDAQYNYVGDLMPVSDVPKIFVKIPFGALVFFPSEALYIITFWGGFLI